MHKEQDLKTGLKVLNENEMGIGRVNNDFKLVMDEAQFGEKRSVAIEGAPVEQMI